ncbi:MAG: IS66 family transposase, partial [Lachnospiraceae bacterium]|nr:IS66 family transposase [Lachnospiraceae bacterium]
MENKLTPDNLKGLDQSELIELIISQQEQIEKLDARLQHFMEEVADANRRRFGRSSEKFVAEGQLSLFETGDLVFFNEAEAICDEEAKENPAPSVKHVRPTGKKAIDISKLDVVKETQYYMSDDELNAAFGDEGYKRLPDEIIKRYYFVPSKIGIEEIHVGVYAGRKSDTVKKASFPAYLMKNSLVSPSLESGIINAKFVNAVPFYRIEKQMQADGISITRAEMARWTILSAERYLSVFYNYLKAQMYGYHVLHADETPVLVNKDGRPSGSKSYMWVYKTGRMYEHPIVLYEYQKTRNASHPREFLKDFSGVCMTDGYQVYHTIGKERDDLKIAGCWAHARRRYDEALKAIPAGERKHSLAHKALAMIQAIYNADNALKELPAQERREKRQLIVKPLTEAYFAWCHEHASKTSAKSKTGNGISYSLNQEEYLKVFLDDPYIPLDNNSAEQSIRNFCIGKKNFVMIDT